MAAKKKRRARVKARPEIPDTRMTPARVNEWLDAVRQATQLHGRPPTATHVGAIMGMTPWGARKALKILEAHGYVVDVPKVVSSGQWALTAESEARLPKR